MYWIAVVINVVLVFAIGGPWYGPLFGKAWRKAAGIAEDAPRGHLPVKVFGGAAVFGAIAAITLGWMLGPAPALVPAIVGGLAGGIGLSGATFGINYLFASRPMAMLAIDGGYNVVLLTAMGVVFGLLH